MRTHHRLAYVLLFQHRKEISMNASMAVIRFISIVERKFFKDVYTAVMKVQHLMLHEQLVGLINFNLIKPYSYRLFFNFFFF